MNGATIPFVTKCRYCTQTWPSPVAVVGQSLDSIYYALAYNICGHLQVHLKKLSHEDAAAVQSFVMDTQMPLAHWFYLHYFDTTDPELIRYCDRSRHAVWSVLRTREVSDAELEAQVEKLDKINQAAPWLAKHVNSSAEFQPCNWVRREDALELLKALRDTLEERDLNPEGPGGGQPPPRVILAS
jgi:hypothetical protein